MTGTIGVVDYLVVLILRPLCLNMVRDAKVTSSILVWSKFLVSIGIRPSYILYFDDTLISIFFKCIFFSLFLLN